MTDSARVDTPTSATTQQTGDADDAAAGGEVRLDRVVNWLYRGGWLRLLSLLWVYLVFVWLVFAPLADPWLPGDINEAKLVVGLVSTFFWGVLAYGVDKRIERRSKLSDGAVS